MKAWLYSFAQEWTLGFFKFYFPFRFFRPEILIPLKH